MLRRSYLYVVALSSCLVVLGTGTTGAVTAAQAHVAPKRMAHGAPSTPGARPPGGRHTDRHRMGRRHLGLLAPADAAAADAIADAAIADSAGAE
jgi:hypothetical protein